MTTLVRSSGGSGPGMARELGFEVVAHRGFSSRQPEMTVAAYREAVEWSVVEGVPLGLECDVRFSADGELVCVHDAVLGRTGGVGGRVGEWSVAELRGMDFGSWRVVGASVEQRSLVTLADLLGLVGAARAGGAEVGVVVETKHPCERGLGLERRVVEMVEGCGWGGVGSPVRVITFSVAGAVLVASLLPGVGVSLLLEGGLGSCVGGVLPPGVRVAGVEVGLLRRDPGFVERAARYGNEVHAWTVNDPVEMEWCRSLGVAAITTDYPDRAAAILRGTPLAREGPRQSSVTPRRCGEELR